MVGLFSASATGLLSPQLQVTGAQIAQDPDFLARAFQQAFPLTTPLSHQPWHQAKSLSADCEGPQVH